MGRIEGILFQASGGSADDESWLQRCGTCPSLDASP